MTDGLQVAVFGLGSMGFGMAESLVRAGYTTYGYDPVAEQCDRFITVGGTSGTIEQVASDLSAVVVVVLNAAQTESVLFGDDVNPGVVPRLSPGAVVLACATVSPDFAKAMSARCAEYQVHYLDSPISGGAVKAREGALSVMASGSADAFNAARPIYDATAEKVFVLGDEAGPGSAMKAVNQMLAGVHIAAMAEALTFGLTQGVEAETFVEVITQCAGNSWMLENRAPHIVAGDYTPHSAVDIWLKDLGIVLNTAEDAGFEAPITTAALHQFKTASDGGLGREDDAAVAKVYANQVGVKLPGVD